MRASLFILLTLIATGLFAQTEKDQSSGTRKKQRPAQIYIVVEEMPIFKYSGCKSTDDCFLTYVKDNTSKPPNNCKGKVYIQFIVEPDSSVSKARVIHGLEKCPGYKKELEKTIDSMPKWIPGKLRGFPVRVQKTMPIHFKRDD